MTKILFAATLFTGLFSSSAFAQDTTPGSLLFPNSTDSTKLTWGTDTVNAFLATHNIPSTDWTVIQQYGRQDLYDNLRAFAWLRIRAMIASPSTLSSTEQYVLTQFAADATALNVLAKQNAVNEKNRYLANKCTWQPDSTIAAAAGYQYNGADYCPSVPYDPNQFNGPPAISPPKEYFIAYGQKTAWLDPVTARPGGVRSVSQITEGGSLLLGVGLAAAILIGFGSALVLSQVSAVMSKLFPFFEDGEGFVSEAPVIGGIAAGITIALALILIVITIYAYTENARVEAEYPQLDQALQSAQAAGPLNQSTMAILLPTQAGYQLLYSVFLNEFVPGTNQATTRALPMPNPSVDPEFVVGQNTMPSISFHGWQGETYTMQMWGAWLESTVDKTISGVDSPSINTRFRYLWKGIKYEGARAGGVFIASKFQPASTDIDCPPSPSTGLSSATDLTTCKSFTAAALPMDLTSSTQTVSIYQAPIFNPQTNYLGPTPPWTDGFSQNQPRQLTVTASGVPAPTIYVVGGLPAGFTYTAGNPGSGTLSWDGTGALGTYSISFQASNGGSTTNATLTATVYDAVRIVEPGVSNVTLTLAAGTLYSIPVLGVGNPAPSLRTFTLDTCGLSTPNNSGPSFTMSGVIRFPQNPPGATSCNITIAADNINNGSDQVSIIVNVTPPASQPVLVTTTATVPVLQTSQTTIQTTGGTGQVQISLTQGTGGQQLAPSWVSLTDNGNGTATLTMTPPPDAPDTVLVPLWYRIVNTLGNQATSSTDGVTITVNKTPVFRDVPTNGFIWVFSTAGFSSQDQTMNLLNLNGSLSTADPLPAVISGSFNPATFVLNLQGVARVPGYFQSNLVATNSSGSSTAPLQIISLQPAQITSAPRVNFYIGQSNTFTLTAAGFPQSLLANVPAGVADPLRFSGAPPDPGIQLQISDPSTGSPFWGYALLTGSPRNGYGVYPFTISAQTGNNTTLSPINQQSFQLVVTHPGDVNGDGAVNCSDATFITSRYGQETGMVNYDYNADYNHDGVINVKDLAMITPYLPKGTRCN